MMSGKQSDVMYDKVRSLIEMKGYMTYDVVVRVNDTIKLDRMIRELEHKFIMNTTKGGVCIVRHIAKEKLTELSESDVIEYIYVSKGYM